MGRSLSETSTATRTRRSDRRVGVQHVLGQQGHLAVLKGTADVDARCADGSCSRFGGGGIRHRSTDERITTTCPRQWSRVP